MRIKKRRKEDTTRTISMYGEGDNGERVLGIVDLVPLALFGRSSNLLSLPLLVGGLGVVIANELELA
jgi:hypothetical protein